MITIQFSLLSQGTNFKLVDVIKFNKLLNFLSPYYITLLAQDSVSGSHQNFQVQVNELRIGRLDMIVPIARPKGKHLFFFFNYYQNLTLADY